MSIKDLETFDEIVYKIKSIINQFEKTNVKDKTTKIFLSDGTSFNYSISESNLAHLLGVNTNYLISTGIIKSKRSFEVLNELYEKRDYIREMIKNNHLNLKYIFSEYIREKIEYFFENTNINIRDTYFICKYNRDKAINQGNIHQDCEYIIVKENEEHNILVLQLKQKRNNVIPMSSKIFSGKNEAEDYFKDVLTNQTLLMMSSIIVNSYIFDQGKKIFLNHYERKNHLAILKNFQVQYGCYIDITYEYEYYLNGSNNQKQRNIENHDTINNIISCIEDGKIITEESLGISIFDELPYDIRNLVYALNDNITNSSKSKNGQIAYSRLQTEIANLKKAKQSLIEENEKIKTELVETQTKLNSVTEENQNLLSFQEDIEKVYKKYKMPSN